MPHQTFIRVSTLLAIVLFSTSAFSGHPWEYLVKTYPLLGNDQVLTQMFNKLGKQHWELVNCTEGDAQLTCIYKRLIQGN